MLQRDQIRSRARGRIDLLTALIVVGIVGIAAVVVISQRHSPIHVTPAADFATDAVSWRTSFADAQKESQSTGRPMLVDFTASWCPPCKVMKQQTWTDPNVIAKANSLFIPVLIDVDEQPDVAKQFGIKAVPTIKVLSGGSELYSGNFHTSGQLLEAMSELVSE